jgi:surfactin synthase thioesterase subunit
MKQIKIFLIKKIIENPSLRIFCFPYAGGSANTFFPWIDRFSDDIELVLIQPPGRGVRMMESPHDNVDGLLHEIMTHSEYFATAPYIIFGHSLGSRVAFELCCRFITHDIQLPSFFIASGSGAPHILSDKKSICHLPKDEFISELRKLKGTPEEILANGELMDILIPVLRADFKIANTHLSHKVSMPFPISVLHGEDDIEISDQAISLWKELSDVSCEIVNLPGDHFFIEKFPDSVINLVRVISDKLLADIKNGKGRPISV